MNIWTRFDRPFSVLAPMDDVTDITFRKLVRKWAAPDILFTEFASVDGMMSSGRNRVEKKLRLNEDEDNLVAQLWGLVPENFEAIARELSGAGFAGIDLNMGCPVPKVIKKGACSALAKNHQLAGDIIEATKSGAGKLPVSVKCRLGFKEIDMAWIQFLLEQDIDCLIVHGRTTSELSKVPNHFEAFPEIMNIRDKISPQTPVVINGDIMNQTQGEQICKEMGIDGFMIGRGIFKDPFAFSKAKEWSDVDEPTRIAMYREHVEQFIADNPDGNFNVLKRFSKVYINGFDGASSLRTAVVNAKTLQEILSLIK